jgi:hypothetical protein
MTDLIRKMPVRTRPVQLKEQWAGWEFTARMNPPVCVFEDIASGDFARIVDGMTLVIVSWNWVNEVGEPLPEPSRAVISGNVPIDLLTAAANGWVQEMTTVPPA